MKGVATTIQRRKERKPLLARLLLRKNMNTLCSVPHPCHSRPFQKSFNPSETEKGVYDWWDKEKELFSSSKPKKGSGPHYSMVIPPPNVTGQLHIGHALTMTIQDSLVRWRKMLGDTTVFVPGVDHAGIATQTVVEKRLQKTLNKTRHDFSRQEFLDHIWDWYHSYNSKIDNQLKHLGSSLDWNRKVFTMDSDRCEAVTKAFIELYNKGLIYRSTRFIHWCPHLRTVISDLEIEYEELKRPTKLQLPGRKDKVEFGVMHEFAYPIENSDSELVVGTTRLETMLGDVAIAIHPEDGRHRTLHGKYAIHPFYPDKRLPIVFDEDLVDMEMGTGAVKITPAHDEADFKCAKKHNLPLITILNEDGTLNGECGPKWAGKDRFTVREELVRELSKLELYRGKKPNSMRLARCSRSGDVIEPLLKPQWFLKCDEMAARALHFVENGDIAMQPEYHKKTWRHFLSNIHDWCISRQLWWGHRIPAYRVVGTDDWVVAESKEEALKQLKTEGEVEQDPDVLDTWFSSSLFPMTALGWPQTPIDENSYPLSLMETGTDILFFWVARMAMVCSELDPESRAPFKKVFLHPIVRDREGRKMSKSLGNVIDPLHVINGVSLEELTSALHQGNLDNAEVKRATKNLKTMYPDGIEACGTDALRLTLASYMTNTGTEGINMDIHRVVVWRQFCNKIWNSVKFYVMNRDAETILDGELERADLESVDLEHKWILSRLARCVAKCNAGFAQMEFSKVTDALYLFAYSEFCDYYIEMAKLSLKADQDSRATTLATLSLCLDTLLKLMHPIVPFVTEELWHRLNDDDKTTALCELKYPTTGKEHCRDLKVEQEMALVIDVVKATRRLREMLVGLVERAKLSDSKVTVVCKNPGYLVGKQEHVGLIQHLTRMKNVEVVGAVRGFSEDEVELSESVGGDVLVLLRVSVDSREKEKISKEGERLNGKYDSLKKEIEELKAKWSSPKYLSKAPTFVKENNASRLVNMEAELNAVQNTMLQFGGKNTTRTKHN